MQELLRMCKNIYIDSDKIDTILEQSEDFTNIQRCLDRLESILKT